MKKKLTEILNEINFSATGNFEPSEIAKCIQAVEDKGERRIIAQAIIGDHAHWLVNKMCETPSAGGWATLKSVARDILRYNNGSYGGSTTPLIWEPLGAHSLAAFCNEAADSDVIYNDFPF